MNHRRTRQPPTHPPNKGGPSVHHPSEGHYRRPGDVCVAGSFSIGDNMGKRGPAKQPTALRLMRGDPSKLGKPKAEPKPTGRVRMPDYLKGEARKKWNAMVPVLEAAGVMKSTDAETLARYCALWELWLSHYRAYKDGHYQNTLLNPDGSIKYQQVTPDGTQLMKLNQQLLRLEQEFGLTPSARAGIAADNPMDNDELGQFLKEA